MKDQIDWIVTFDTETTGIDVLNDRIIQAFVGKMSLDGEWIDKREWLIDPGVDVPKGASDVHGYTTERLRAEGRKDAEECIVEIADTILEWAGWNRPLVAYNAAFDVSILTSERRRARGSIEFAATLSSRGIPVIDPLVCDKAKDRYRRGSRKLVDVAPVYGVPVEENAHDAGADCLMTGRVCLKQLAQWRGSVAGLHQAQVGWKREQNESLEAYFEKSGKRNEDGSKVVIDRGWPVYDKVINPSG